MVNLFLVHDNEKHFHFYSYSKALDVPYYARKYNIVRILKRMVSKEDGVVHEDAVKKMDTSMVYTNEEMQLILAQLNVLKSLIDYQKRTKNYNVI